MPLDLPRAPLAASCLLLALTAANAFGNTPSTHLDGMQWRLVGPFRAGWSTMAAGVADQPDTFSQIKTGRSDSIQLRPTPSLRFPRKSDLPDNDLQRR